MLVLASRSPRRSELLRNAGIPFIVRPADVDETPRAGERAQEYTQRIAEEKARAAETEPGEVVLGADTVVTIDGHLLGKPSGNEDAARMLRMLSGRRHEVFTGICLKRGDHIVRDCAQTAVWFAPLSAPEIRDYITSEEPMDKAGAYAIQGLASKFIERIDGSYGNVVGLPVALVYHYLREFFEDPNTE